MEHAPAWLINSFIYLAAAVIAVPVAKSWGWGRSLATWPQASRLALGV